MPINSSTSGSIQGSGNPVISRWIAVAGALLIAALYIKAYFAHPALPTTTADGWWTWWDQSNYLKSATALWHRDFSVGLYVYPLGYSAIGAAFVAVAPAHPFFVPNLLALLASYFAFIGFARCVGVNSLWAALVFLGASVCDPELFQHWVAPWTTTPVAALIWISLWLSGRYVLRPDEARAKRRYFVIGLVAACVMAIHPVDVLVPGIFLLAMLLCDLIEKRTAFRHLLSAIYGGLCIVIPYLLVYLRIYHFHTTDYLEQSAKIGFVFWNFLWKLYVIFFDPYPWFAEGRGILQRAPWIALAVPALLLLCARQLHRASRREAVIWMLAAATVFYTGLYVAYVDLLPNGLWRYGNIHYFTWVMPAYALLGFLLIQRLFQRRRAIPLAALIASLVLLSIRLEPREVPAGSPALMVNTQFDCGGWANTYMGRFTIADAKGQLESVYGVRALPMPEGVRFIAIRRPLVGNAAFVKGCADASTGAAGGAGAQTHWNTRVRFGRPAWLPPFHDPLNPHFAG
ncbi:hypothetical protein PQR02_20890 [Paraburkholderia sediminicola]|uniref:Uncharacterized protein n=1 Tax=Paraburkholderia rhynchosiae TaxID=487049 RepID=A0ACC7N9F4_9BURK